jgi:hypothetical protein
MSKQNVKLILKILSDFGVFKGLAEQKNVVFNSFVCKLGSFWHSWAHSCQKKTNLHANSLWLFVQLVMKVILIFMNLQSD